MLAAVVAVYAPPELLLGRFGLVGLDYYQIHLQRLRYAQDHLAQGLPGWHTRELLGAPFWSNLQSFPWIPTRLALLFCDPYYAYAPGVLMAALLAALFTYLYARGVGMGRPGSAAAGWTFAAAGFFAARVMAGHLPLLEAYPALPLFLWLMDREGRAARLGLAAAGAAALTAGHPQLSIYAAGAACLYALWRHPPAAALRRIAVLALGVACGSCVLWPMTRLIARSTRLLALDPPRNNVALPYARLAALVLPWRDGWPADVAPGRPFALGDQGVFWDTVNYIGLMPLAAAGWLAWRRRPGPPVPWAFFAAVGGGALLLALPVVADLAARLPGTLLRSPARLLYLTGFALALAFGAAVDHAWGAARRSPQALPRLLWGLALVAHGADLGYHASWFVRTRLLDREVVHQLNPWMVAQVDGGRAAIDFNYMIPENRYFDDAGFFDSLMLARPYAGVLALAGSPPGRNTQAWNAGAELPPAALAALSVHLVVTSTKRKDLPAAFENMSSGVYRVPAPAPRASYFAGDRVRTLEPARLAERLRAPGVDLRAELLIEPEAGAAPRVSRAGATASVDYERPSPDAIELAVTAPEPGFVLCTESWDEGWAAEVDGAPAPVVRAYGFLLAAAVPAGPHAVRFRFATPGARAGRWMSLCSLALLAVAAL